MVKNARLRAEQRGIPFALTIDHLEAILPMHCPVLGMPIRFHVGEGRGPRDDSPSLDCIIRDRGYVPGNVIIVSSRANRIKSDASLGELRAIADFYSRYDPSMDQAPHHQL